MRLALDQVEETVKHLDYVEAVDELNDRLRCGTCDFQLPAGLAVQLEYYRAGVDVYLHGELSGEVRATCARCAEEFTFPMTVALRTVLSPRPLAPGGGGEEDLGLDFYDAEEIDVTGLVYEQALLALPTRAVCTEACRGLCPQCGTNLNDGPCGCEATRGDSPFAALVARRRRPA